MSAATAEAPYVVHAIPGRLRVHLPHWSGRRQHRIETALRQVPGTRSAEANPVTGNLLITYDPALTDEQSVVAAVRDLDVDTAPLHHGEMAAMLTAHEH